MRLDVGVFAGIHVAPVQIAAWKRTAEKRHREQPSCIQNPFCDGGLPFDEGSVVMVSRHTDVDERTVSAIARWTTAAEAQARADDLVDSSRWLTASTRATVTRRRPAIQGGGEPVAFNPGSIKARLQNLIRAGNLPPIMPRRMFVGVCLESHPCAACGFDIREGEREFEWTNETLVVFFHPRCLEIYRTLD